MIHTAFFYIPVIFAFNSPHFINSYMHHTGKKRKKKRKKKVTKKFASRGLEPSESINANKLSLKEVYIPSL